MHIDAYSFGRITIDGEVFTKDVIILHDRVISPWWRNAGGHVFAIEDLGEVLEAEAEVVLLGTGAYGFVRVRDDLVAALEKAGARVVAGRTADVVGEFNRLVASGHKVVAALHLTC